MFPCQRWRFLLLLLPLAGCSSAKRQVVAFRLEALGDTVITPYGDIPEAVWLGGMRWAVVAPQDRAVGLVDFGQKTVTPFDGASPRALSQPFHIFRAGDSLYIGDWAKRRITSWSLTGRPGASVPASDAYRGTLPSARDTLGRWYIEVRAAPGADGRGNLDSALVLRTTPDLSRADTVARLAPLDMVEVASDGGRRLERRLLSGQDRWGALPDGSVWLARVSQNRVDWQSPSGETRIGDELPDRVLPVTESDREIFLSHFDAALRPTVAETPFAAIKPPFDAAMADSAGQVWLVTSRAVGDTLRDYQIVDRHGHLRAEAAHPGLGRTLGLGGGYALVGEPFARGVRLLLFRVPARAAGRSPLQSEKHQ